MNQKYVLCCSAKFSWIHFFDEMSLGKCRVQLSVIWKPAKRQQIWWNNNIDLEEMWSKTTQLYTTPFFCMLLTFKPANIYISHLASDILNKCKNLYYIQTTISYRPTFNRTKLILSFFIKYIKFLKKRDTFKHMGVVPPAVFEYVL